MSGLIKTYAKEVIKKYELTYPLDINEFIDVLGFEVKYVDTGTCDGYTIILNGKKLILLNEKITVEERIRFTLAHELGHYFIPHHMKPIYACNTNEKVSTKYLLNASVEKEADIFASELLIPSGLVNTSIQCFDDILDIAAHYRVSIQAAAIKIMEYSNDIICFICCKDNRIAWYTASEDFKENLKLKDINGIRIPEFSSYNTCVDNCQNKLEAKVPAFVWIDNIDDDVYIEEESLYYSKYNTGYILIKAENAVNYEI